jgi:hypothetical protein
MYCQMLAKDKVYFFYETGREPPGDLIYLIKIKKVIYIQKKITD